MKAKISSRVGRRVPRMGGVMATAALAIAALPVAAQAEIVGTHVVTPQAVTPHVVTPSTSAATAAAPAPAPAPAPVAAPVSAPASAPDSSAVGSSASDAVSNAPQPSQAHGAGSGGSNDPGSADYWVGMRDAHQANDQAREDVVDQINSLIYTFFHEPFYETIADSGERNSELDAQQEQEGEWAEYNEQTLSLGAQAVSDVMQRFMCPLGNYTSGDQGLEDTHGAGRGCF